MLAVVFLRSRLGFCSPRRLNSELDSEASGEKEVCSGTAPAFIQDLVKSWPIAVCLATC